MEEKEHEIVFQGYDGATSLKSEIACRIHDVNDASTYRQVPLAVVARLGAVRRSGASSSSQVLWPLRQAY